MQGECDCCNYGPVELKSYRRGGTIDDKWNLCNICASTLVSTRVGYSREDAPALQTIAWVGNAILARLNQEAPNA